MPKKRKRLPDPDGGGKVDVFTLPELVRCRRLILTYNPFLDEIQMDDDGFSPLEARALLTAAAEQFCAALQE